MSDIRADDDRLPNHRTGGDGLPGERPPAAARVRRVVGVLVGGTVLAFVVGTIGPPLFGRGVFLTTDLVALAYPWQAFDEPVSLGVGEYGPTSDTVDATYPQRARFGEDARSGDFTGWDPWIGGGQPLGATSSSGVLNPLALPFVAVPAWYAPALVKLLGLAAALGFTFLWCRRLGTGRVPAVLGGLAYAGSGYLLMWTNWPQADVAALLPALFWTTERFLQRRTAAAAVPVALALAAALLGNFPAIVGYALYVLVVYVAVRLGCEHHAALRRALRPAAGVAAALVAGVALVSATLIPFGARLADLDTSHREQDAGENLGVPNLLTTVAPGAFGLSSDGRLFQGPGRNQVESVAYLGVVPVLLALCAAALPAARRVPAGAVAGLLAPAGVLAVAVFGGGPVLAGLQRLPVFSDNYVGRALSVLGLAGAALAALGLEAVLDLRGRRLVRREAVRAGGVAVLALTVAAVVGVRSVQWVRPFGGGDALRSELMLPVVAGAVAATALVLLRRVNGAWVRGLAVSTLPVLLAVQSLDLAVPLLPHESRDSLYPETPAQDFVADHVGAGRIAAQGQTFYGNVPMMWGVRTFTGHAFHSPTWKDAILAIDHDAFAGNPSETFPSLDGTPEVATSPLLDRLGVSWFAVPPGTAPFGTVEAGTLAASTCDAPSSATGDAPVGGSPVTVPAGEAGLRGVVVRVCGEGVAVPYGSALVVTARAGDGEVVGRARLRDHLPAGDLTVPVPGDSLAGRDGVEVRLALEGAPGAELSLAATPDGRPGLDVVRPADDGLALAYADDLLVYERTRALPRIRWASAAEVVTDPEDRLRRLSSGDVDGATVVLSDGDDRSPDGSDETEGDDTGGDETDLGDGGDAAGREDADRRGADGGDAVVSVDEDGPDTVTARVDAPAAGYLVVADALQDDWAAQVDGEDVPLVDADHAGVAVAVPAGRHEVRLILAPRGQRPGILAGALTAGVLVAVGGLSLRRRRRHPVPGPGSDDQRPAAPAVAR